MLQEESGENTIGSQVREAKLEKARYFFKHLPLKNIRFVGVAGSVSYVPREDDDIDIFLICSNGKLWGVLLEALIVRRRLRMDDICISLCMDADYAVNLFSREAEYVVASDAVHVIPLHGSTFYRRLLSGSPMVRKYYPELAGDQVIHATEERGRYSALECFAYLFIAPYLILRSLMGNHRIIAQGRDGSFRTRVGYHHFYFDSVKYERLRKEGPAHL